MSKSPTSYVSRLDPQFRRFVNVVNVYPSSDTSASNDDLSKDGAASLASGSCPELNKDIISVDAYTEENWPPSPSMGRQVSELFLEYANILSSESETSFHGNDNDIGTATCASTSPNLREDPRNTSSSEQRYSLDGIRNDCFEDDSVFWSDGDDERSHSREKKINQCLQKIPGVSNKRQTLDRLPMASFSSEADSEGSFRYRNETEGSLDHFGDTAQFLAGKDCRWNESISPTARRRDGDQEVISGYPQGTSRQIADSFEDLSSVASELGYVPDVIEEDYLSTSSADSGFMCFALVGKQDDKGTKRKMASKEGRAEQHKKHRHNYGDSSKRPEFEGQDSDRGLMACVVPGISGGPAIRVFRNEDSHRVTKSKSRSLYQREGALPYVGRTDGDSTDHNALKGPRFHDSGARSDRDSVFALTAAPSISLVRDEQRSKPEGKWDTEGVMLKGVTGVEADKGVSAGYPENHTRSKCYNDPEATKPEKRVTNKAAGKYDDLPSKRGNSHGAEFDYELNSSINLSTEYENVNVIPNAPGDTTFDYQRSSQDELGILQSDHLSTQIPSDQSPFYGSEEVKNISYPTKQKQIPEDSMTRSTGHGNVQGKVVPIKIRSIKREVTSKTSRKSPSEGERLEGNLQDNEKEQVKDTMAPVAYGSELKMGDAEKISQATDPSWPARENNRPHKDLRRGPVEHLPDRAKMKNTVDGSLTLEPTGGEAFGSYKQQQGYQTTDKHGLKAKRVREDTCLVKDEVKEECTDTEAKDGIIDSQLLEIDNGRPGKDVSQRPSSRSTQQRTYNPVTKRKYNENERQGKNPTKKSKRPFETSPKHNELHSKLTGDLPRPSTATEPHARRRSSGAADESLAKTTERLLQKSNSAVEGNECKRHSTKKAERELQVSLDDDSKHSSIEKILPFNDKDKDDGNCNSNDNVSDNDFSLVPVFKEKQEKGGSQEVISKEKADTIATHEQLNQSCQEDEVGRTMRKTKSALDAHFQPTDDNYDGPHNMNDKSSGTHLSETDLRRFRKNVSQLSNSPSSKERSYTHVPRQRRIPERKKQVAVLSKGSEASTNGDHLQLADALPDPTRAREPYSQKETTSNKPEESWAKALESLDDVEPSNEAKEYQRDFVKETEQRGSQPLNGGEKKANDFTLQSKETVSPVLLSGIPVAQSNSLTHDTRGANSLPEITGERYVTPMLPVEPLETAASLKPCGNFDVDIHKKNETSTVETPETSSTLLQSNEGVKKEDLFLNESEPKNSTMGSPICEHVTHEDSKTDHANQEELTNTLHTSLQKSVERNSGVPDNITSLVDESEDLVGETKLSSVHEEGFACEKAVRYFIQQPSAITTLPGKETPVVEMVFDMSEKPYEKENVDSFEDVTKTDLLPKEQFQLLALTDNTIRHYQDSDITSRRAVQDAAERHVVTEDVCFVALDVNDNPFEDGALPTTEAMFSSYLDETADCLEGKTALADNITDPMFAEVGTQSEEANLVEVKELDSNGKNGSGKVEVEEVVCSYEGLHASEIRHTYSENNYFTFQGQKERSNVEISTQDDLRASTWVPFGKPQPDKSDRLQHHLLQDGNRDEEGNSHRGPMASAKTQKLDSYSKAESDDGKQGFGTFKAGRFHSGNVIREGTDQQRQVDVLKGIGSPPECKTKGSQKSFSYNGVNAACQTNETLEVSSPRKAFLQQSVECQTEVQTNVFASVGVQVKLPNPRSEEKIVQRETALGEDGDSGEEAQARINDCQHVEKDCQTSPGYELVLTSSKECQINTTESANHIYFYNKECQTTGSNLHEFVDCGTSTAEDGPSRLVSLTNKECQTSLHNVLVTSSTQCEILTVRGAADESAVKKISISRFTSYDDKECQTVLDNDLLRVASKECQTFSWSHNSEENEKAVVETEIPCESKECQTLLDTDFLLAALKEYQNSFYSYASGETKKTGVEAGMSHESKENQTLFDSDFIPSTSSWTHTSGEITFLREEAENSHENKECQTVFDFDLIPATSIQCQPSLWSNTSGEITKLTEEAEKTYESKECQTFLDTDLLFATSKACQTSFWSYTSDEIEKAKEKTEIFYESKECQTILDSDLLLVTSKQCQTSWYNDSGDIAKLGKETEISSLSKESQTEIGLPAVSSKETQTMPEFVVDGSFKIPTDVQAHQCKYFVYNNKECQTDPGLMNDHHYLSTLSLKLAKADSVAHNNQTTDSLERNKPTYDTKACQTATTVSSSKLCQTSNLESAIEYHSRESQTSPDGDMYLATSKECQTVAYTLDDLKLLAGQIQVSNDVELFNDAETEEYANTPCSPQMGPLQGASRPSTYGKSPDEPEVFRFKSTSRDGLNDTELCKTTTSEFASKPADFVLPVAFAEIGCQAMLCHCGHFVDELQNENTCSSVSSDPQNGYLFYVFTILACHLYHFLSQFIFCCPVSNLLFGLNAWFFTENIREKKPFLVFFLLEQSAHFLILFCLQKLFCQTSIDDSRCKYILHPSSSPLCCV